MNNTQRTDIKELSWTYCIFWRGESRLERKKRRTTTNDDDDDDDDNNNNNNSNNNNRVMRQTNVTKVFRNRRSWNVYKLLFLIFKWWSLLMVSSYKFFSCSQQCCVLQYFVNNFSPSPVFITHITLGWQPHRLLTRCSECRDVISDEPNNFLVTGRNTWDWVWKNLSQLSSG